MSYFIDVQGTLLDDIDRKPIPGACEFIAHLNQEKIPYVVVTNNTKIKSDVFHQHLCDLGLDIPAKNYLDPFMVLKKNIKERDVAVFGADEFVKTLSAMGFDTQTKNPKAMLIASKKDFSSDDYAAMIETALHDVNIIGMHATSIYAKDGKRYPGVGAILEMLRYATSKDYRVIGKPSPAFYNEALGLLQEQSKQEMTFKEVTMISDDAIGDLCGIKELGSQTILVLSGKCQSIDEIKPIKDYIDDVVLDIGHIKR
ncbi:HAD-IIA family hydrolase [Sulfurospirillum sp. 1612]|uniref:HAD-IIA family hydrolase n=1 Tax=Sulfurospirillum sp. 1612 TaxID=3094835 RepID=UPI002F928102